MLKVVECVLKVVECVLRVFELVLKVVECALKVVKRFVKLLRQRGVNPLHPLQYRKKEEVRTWYKNQKTL